MNEERIIKEIQSLKDQMVTKKEIGVFEKGFNSLSAEVKGLDVKVSNLDQKITGIRNEISGFRGDLGNWQIEVGSIRKDMMAGFKEVGDKIDDLNLSSKSFDDLREQNPIPRIDRLEKHAGLPEFVPTISEDEE